jgi:hypothetical protein
MINLAYGACALDMRLDIGLSEKVSPAALLLQQKPNALSAILLDITSSKRYNS